MFNVSTSFCDILPTTRDKLRLRTHTIHTTQLTPGFAKEVTRSHISFSAKAYKLFCFPKDSSNSKQLKIKYNVFTRKCTVY